MPLVAIASATAGLLLLLWLVSHAVQRSKANETGHPYGPIKWFLVFASGAKLDLLRRCPSEEVYYCGLGGAVIMTATVAAFSSIVALTVALGGGHDWHRYIPFGLAYGTMIFLIDRFLVSAPLNPYRVSSEPGALGSGPRSATAVWDAARTFAAAMPRFALAVVVAFLIAEPLLLIIFSHEVGTEVGKMRTELAAEAERKVREGRQTRLEDLQEPTAVDQDHDGVNDIKATEDQLTKVQDDIDKVDQDIDAKNELLDEETRQGVVIVAGRRTTGVPGCGPRCRQLKAEIQLDKQRLSRLRGREQQLSRRLQTLRDDIAGDEKARTSNLKKLEDEIDAKVRTERTKAEATSGLLIQIDALERLASDRTPFGDTAQPRRRGLLGLTSLGMAVWALRTWIVLLDVMPVAFKLLLSLRRRRPYDALVAEQEHVVQAQVAARLDRLNQDLQAAIAHHAAERARGGRRYDREAAAWFDGQAPWLLVTGPFGSQRIKPGEQATVGGNAASTLVVDDPRLNGSQLTIDWQNGQGWVIKER
jgi:hypothetical protein